jgi:hypothetical protein
VFYTPYFKAKFNVKKREAASEGEVDPTSYDTKSTKRTLLDHTAGIIIAPIIGITQLVVSPTRAASS